jgi:hypothetical protein
MACDWFLFEVCDMLCMRAVIGLSEIVSYTVIGTNYIPYICMPHLLLAI